MSKQFSRRKCSSLSAARYLACLVLCFLFALPMFGNALLNESHRPQKQPVLKKKLPTLMMKQLFDSNLVTSVKALTRDGIQEIRSNEDLNRVTSGSVLVARVNEDVVEESLGEGSFRFILPYRFKVSGPGASQEMNLLAVAEVEQGGLRFDPQGQRFTGSVLIGIKDKDKEDAPPIDLSVPVEFQFTFNMGNVLPGNLNINHTSLPYPRIELAAMGIPSSPRLKIMTTFDTDGEEIEIPMVRPQIELRGPETIPGLGFGYGDVSVTLLSPDLIGYIREVTLHTDKGILKPIQLSLSDKGRGEANLRSAGIGVAKIEIVDQHLESTPVSINFVWPWLLMISILFGAVVSGVLFSSSKGKFIVGFLLGVVVAVAFCAGINLVDINLGKVVTVAVVFVAAALPGFLRFPLKSFS